MKGYVGKVLFVDLSNGEIHAETIPDSIYEQFLSGVGLGAYVLYHHIPADADPLGPKNILGFVSGLLSGTPSFDTGRWMVVCKSPLTGGWGDANCGGTFSPAIKQCGYDGIFISGVSETPVYLFVDHKGAQIRPASHVWGMDAIETEEVLRKENWKTKRPEIAVIGTSAEKLSLISGISNDGGRIAARSGVGAVMGSKRLKAVVLAGVRPVGCYDPVGMKSASKKMASTLHKLDVPRFFNGWFLTLLGKVLGSMKRAAPLDGIITTMMLKKWGTIFNNTLGVVAGDSPVRNWNGSAVDFNSSYYRWLNPDRIVRRETDKYHCYSCFIGCGGHVAGKGAGNEKSTLSHKPEYETTTAFGHLLMNKDLDGIFLINDLLNRAGMDSISAGNTVAFAFECFEKGLITRDMTGGLDLKWGDSKAIITLVKMMIDRVGIGDLLADGVKVASKKLGPLSALYAVHAGGQEPGMHDPRMDPQIGVHYSVDPTPGRHTVGSAQLYDVMHLWDKVSWAPNPGAYDKAGEYFASEQLALKTVAGSCFRELSDGAGGCYFAMLMGLNHWDLFDYLNKGTGWEKTPDEYMEIGRRIQTLRQMFNIKHGIDPWQFKISSRIAGEPPLSAGPLKGKTLQIDEMMRMHWKKIGWDENTGIPTPETLKQLGLDAPAINGAAR
jgi:aldehyde:ferredoxin oxidoreductase